MAENNEELNRKNQLLLKIVSENNNLQMKLRRATFSEKEIWGEPVRRVIELGKEVLDYSNFLMADELSDFCNLYRTANFISSPKMSPAGVREKSAEQFMKLVIGQEDLLHKIIIPTIPKDKTVQAINEIHEEMDNLKYNLNYLEVSFLFIDRKIDQVVNAQRNLTPEQKTELKSRLTKEFRKLRELSNYVRDYFDGIVEIIEHVLADYVTSKEISEIKSKLKMVERMSNKISSSFTTKNVDRVSKNNTEIEEILTTTKSR